MIAVVRDDGDVDAFLVRHIVHAIDRRAEPDSTIGVAGDDIRPFFQSNVEISAWGLAIHTEARILAVSSNAHEVRVFKFGLLRADEDVAISGEDEELSDSEDEVRERKTDVTLHVLNGEANIPHIAFCNTGNDPEARWLLTTDISGVCRVMDLDALQAVQAFRFGRSFAAQYTGGFDHLNAGWAIMFLDRRSFQPEESIHTALGLQEDHTLAGYKRSDAIWDLSKTIQHLPESYEPFVERRTKKQNLDSRLDTGSSEQQTTEVSVELDTNDPTSSDVNDDSDSDGGVPVDIEIELPEADQDGSQDMDSEVSEHYHEPTSIEDITQEQLDYEDNQSLSPISLNYDDHLDPPSPILVDDAEDPDDEGTEDTISPNSLYNGTSIHSYAPRFTSQQTPLCDGLPCPILHASVRNIYLLQPPAHLKPNSEDNSFALTPPLLGFANPLRQSIQRDFEFLRLFDRLNMHAYIPELGIVVLASQKGRAIVLALTKFVSTKSSASRSSERSVYCMRVTAILPFSSQEEKWRPFVPLHGLAVAPVQGRGREEGRWRLMMLYQDHSILSYELRRERYEGGQGGGVESVVV